MDRGQTNFFIKLGIINLCIVAAVGVLMRYKIGFEFPFFDQKHLLYAHLHFAFVGWVSHVLYTLMVAFLHDYHIKSPSFIQLIRANLICAYSMLISFTIQGYGLISIIFTALSILVGYIFAYQYFTALKTLPREHPSKNWFKAAVLFNVLSSLATFYLVYMMATNNIQQHAYLGSVYFYLHFQYSGWFFFAIMGLLMAKLKESNTFRDNSKIFKTFFVACIPGYFLSILWADLPW